MRKKDGIGKPNILVGLKRASWLFALVFGFVKMIIVASDRGWDDPEDYLPGTILFIIIGFILFRIGIWVFGFNSQHGYDRLLV